MTPTFAAQRRTGPGLAALIAAGVALRLLIAPLGAHPGDLPALSRWADALAAVGLAGVYPATDANYPPAGLALIAASRGLFGLLAPGQNAAGPLWLVCLKLPAIAADAAAMGIAARLGDGRRGPVAALAFNPALILMSAWWGQIDSVYAALALASVAAAGADRPLRAGLALGAGGLVKLQGLASAPAALIACLRTEPEGGRLSRAVRLGAGFGLAAAAGLLPFALIGQAGLVMQRSAALLTTPGWLTVNALNGWYLLTGGAGNWAFNAPLTAPDTADLLPGLPYRLAGALLLAGWTITVAALAWRRTDRAGWLLAGALLQLGLFLWPTGAHERYALGALPLLAAAWAACPPDAGRRFAGLLTLLTLGHTLNLLWAAPPHPALEPLAGGRAAGLILAVLLTTAGLWGLAALAMRPPSH